KQVPGTAAYRFDNLPLRTVSKTLPESLDLNRIAGVVRLAGGSGGDTIEINAQAAGGLDVIIQKQVLNLADFEFDRSALPALPAGITYDDVDGALYRANKETEIAVLDRLAAGETPSYTVNLTIDTIEETFRLQPLLDALDTAAAGLTPTTAAETAYRNSVVNFATRGDQLVAGEDPTNETKFSVNSLESLLNSTVLRSMLSSTNVNLRNAATTIQTALTDLRDYLTLIAVSRDLEVEGYSWTADSALKVYRQNSPEVAARSTIYKYNQKIFDSGEYDRARDWKDRTGPYQQRFDPYDDASNSGVENEFDDNDTTGESRNILEIQYSIPGDALAPRTIGGFGTPLQGNETEQVKQYVAALDNLDTSYYTYSYYGVDGNGDRALEAVAIRRLNQDDSAVNALVHSNADLTDGIYLTVENWPAYASAVGRAAIGSEPFTDANVKELIEVALEQTQRTDITAPLFDGLVVARNNVEHIIDIQTVQDDDGFVVPEEITVNKSTPAAVNVPAAYVSERITAENEVQRIDLG
ncbi:MAG: hypothetical protein VB875_16880, partial [Pirellulales bacterium]